MVMDHATRLIEHNARIEYPKQRPAARHETYDVSNAQGYVSTDATTSPDVAGTRKVASWCIGQKPPLNSFIFVFPNRSS